MQHKVAINFKGHFVIRPLPHTCIIISLSFVNIFVVRKLEA